MPNADVTPSDDYASRDEDARLMLAVQAGDAFAFEELMTRNQNRVCAFLQRLVGNLQLAEDLTQEVFMRVYKSRESYRPDALFSTWLYRIARNVALNSLRAKSRRPELLFSGATRGGGKKAGGSTSSLSVEGSLLSRSGATPTRRVAKLEMQTIVRAAVDALGTRQREALLLARFEGMSYQEIADAMNLTPKAVKSLLSRARLNLKEALAPYVEEEKRSQ